MEIANYEAVGLALFALLSVLPVVPVLLCGWHVLKEHRSRKSMKRLLLVTGAVVLLYGAIALDAFWVEPNSPRLTTIALTGPVARPIRILHLSDLHLEETPNRRDDWLVKTLQTLNPDLILVTGDTHQTDNHQAESLRRVLSSVKAPLGVYHCTGYDNVAMLRDAPRTWCSLKMKVRCWSTAVEP